MQFLTENGRDFVQMGEDRYEITRAYYSNPEEAGAAIVENMMDLLMRMKSSFSIIRVGDTPFILYSFPSDDGFAAQFCEVREDEHGMQFENPLPRVKGSFALPMIMIVREPMTANVLSFDAGVAYGSVAELVLTAINDEVRSHFAGMGIPFPTGAAPGTS